MSHNMASRVFEARSVEEKCHDYTATLEYGLQADSLSEFLRAAILGLGVVLGASAAVYLSFLAISLLFVSLVKWRGYTNYHKRAVDQIIRNPLSDSESVNAVHFY